MPCPLSYYVVLFPRSFSAGLLLHRVHDRELLHQPSHPPRGVVQSQDQEGRTVGNVGKRPGDFSKAPPPPPPPVKRGSGMFPPHNRLEQLLLYTAVDSTQVFSFLGKG